MGTVSPSLKEETVTPGRLYPWVRSRSELNKRISNWRIPEVAG
jgi:hypothetical protein